jgi:hypothetical protein
LHFWYTLNIVQASDSPRSPLVNDLHTWGPALTAEIRARYDASIIRELTQAKVLARRRFTGFEVFLLSGAGLRPYGYSLRYNYVPARTTVLGALMLRAKAREYREAGYTVEPYEDYTKRGRGNIALLSKDGTHTALVTRPSLTLKALRMIATHLAEHSPEITHIQVYVLHGDHEAHLLNAQTAGGLPVTVTQVPLSSVTRYGAKAEPPQPTAAAAADGEATTP